VRQLKEVMKEFDHRASAMRYWDCVIKGRIAVRGASSATRSVDARPRPYFVFIIARRK
jgi:hypothetical protein